jgi:hypothetical protein
MDERLRCDHSVKQLAPRITGMSDNSSIGVRSRIIEGERRDGLQYHIKARAPNGCLCGKAVDATFQLNPRYNRHEDGIVECANLGGHVRVSIPEMDRDIRVD